MANTYDGNGDYTGYADDDNEYGGGGGKPRKMAGISATGPHNGDNSHGAGDHGPGGGDNNYLNEKANEYVRDCLNEKTRMDRKFPIAEKLLEAEIEKVQTTGRLPSKEQKYADIYREKPLRVSQKVLVPIREHPKFNFVGKLLGPKGNSLRRLQEETMCKMTVLGRNSMRDRVKEEELRKSKDPKYSHLNSDLHVEISTVAPPAEAYARIAYAMAELRKYLIPDSNDVIRQQQLLELMDSTHISDDQKPTGYKKILAHGASAGGGGGGGSGGILSGGASGGGSSIGKNMSSYKSAVIGNSTSTYNKSNNAAPKQKVMSILEKARSAMEETYGRGYDDTPPFDHLSSQQHGYDAYAYSQQSSSGHSHNPHGHQSSGMGLAAMTSTGRSGPYDSGDYDTSDYGRRGGDYYQNTGPPYGVCNIFFVGTDYSSIGQHWHSKLFELKQIQS